MVRHARGEPEATLGCFADDADALGDGAVFVSVPHAVQMTRGEGVGGVDAVVGVMGRADTRMDVWLQGRGTASWRRVVIPPGLKAVAR